MDRSINDRHETLHVCRVVTEVCCTRTPYYAGERFNVFSHAVAFVGFMVWAILSQVFSHEGAVGVLQSAFLVSLAIVFGVSAFYHVYQARKSWSRWLRVVDYLCIYVAMSVQSIFLVFLVARTQPERELPWQSIADPIVAIVLVSIVTFGREVDALALGIDTYTNIGPCDPCRYAHIDGDHTVMRIGLNMLFVGQWILYTSMIYESIDHPYNLLILASMAISTIVITTTQVNDYYNLSGVCAKWIPYPHGLFHIAAVVCAVLMAGTNEVVLRFSYR